MQRRHFCNDINFLIISRGRKKCVISILHTILLESPQWLCYSLFMKKQNKNRLQKTRWHRLLGKMLEELLTPVNITVMTEFPIMNDPPEADILLLRRDLPRWSEEQMRLLPDGIRDTGADHILIEFKYTESVNRSVLCQALAYDTFYKRVQKLAQDRVQTVIISSKTPARNFMERFGYSVIERPGVYYSTNPMLDLLPIISLNELTDEPHNLFVKCFSSRKKEKERAFKRLLKSGKDTIYSGLYHLIAGLWSLCVKDIEKESVMEIELTPEKVMEMGKMWEELFLRHVPVERKLAGLNAKEILAGLKPKERLAGLNAKEILDNLSPKERKELEQYLQQFKKK